MARILFSPYPDRSQRRRLISGSRAWMVGHPSVWSSNLTLARFAVSPKPRPTRDRQWGA